MSKSSKTIIFCSSVFLILTLIIVYCVLKNNTAKVPEGTIGNTPGNLYNYGRFAEMDGMVYFANPYDNDSLYSMKSDGTDIKRISDMSVEFINVGGKYVFFYGKPNSATSGIGSVVSKPGMYRIEKNGNHLTALTKDVSRSMVLYGNNIYYQHYTKTAGTTFAKMNLSNNKSTELLPYMITPACMYDGSIYYNGQYDNHYLYKFDTKTETEIPIWEGDIWNPIYDGNYVYYMDVQNNYRLCRYNMLANTVEILNNERTDFFNVYGDYIFYQVSSTVSPALKRMNTDGSNPIIIMNGVFKNINCTSTYTYFQDTITDLPLYRVPTFGEPFAEEFTGAREAMLKELKSH